MTRDGKPCSSPRIR